MSALIIRSIPPYGFYSTDGFSFLPDLTYRRLLSIPSYRSYLGESEVDSGTVELENGDGYLSILFSNPPLGSVAEVYTDAGIFLIIGYVVGISIQRSVVNIRLEG